MFLITKYKRMRKPRKKTNITNRNFGILNKFFNGVNIIRIKPTILLIKNRGYREILFQKLFIKL